MIRGWQIVDRYRSPYRGTVEDRIVSRHFTETGARAWCWLYREVLRARDGSFSIVLVNRWTGAEQTMDVK